MASKAAWERLRGEINSILDEGRTRREGAKDAEERQRIMLWEMGRIRRAFDEYKKGAGSGRRPHILGGKPSKAAEKRWEDKKPSQKTKRP
ncbi:MAG: hypothetical protein QXU82_02645 [Candidatus Aenigmatarchaeota archaeon]